MGELIARYKDLPIAVRAVVAVVAGAIFMWIGVMEDGYNATKKDYDSKKETHASKSEESERAQEKMETQNADDLREEIDQLKKDLVQAQKIMPSAFVMDEVLTYVSKASVEAAVTLVSFTPSTPEPRGEDFRYYETRISIEIEGSYRQNGTFFDLISRMKTMIHIKDIKMKQQERSGGEGGTGGGTAGNRVSLLERLSTALSSYRVNSTAQLVVYSTQV